MGKGHSYKMALLVQGTEEFCDKIYEFIRTEHEQDINNRLIKWEMADGEEYIHLIVKKKERQ